MQFSFDKLREEGHAKHGSRMQFGLFLKGIGMSLPESLQFWKKALRQTSSEKFAREYAYNVRHNYGQEGKRTNYSPFGCNRIITSTPSHLDHHGCPFKIFDTNHLMSYLRNKKKVSDSNCEEIAKFKTNGHYVLACRKYFQIQNATKLSEHKLDIEDIASTWSHPNEYFDNSYRLYHPEIAEKRYKDRQGTENGVLSFFFFLLVSSSRFKQFFVNISNNVFLSIQTAGSVNIRERKYARGYNNSNKKNYNNTNNNNTDNNNTNASISTDNNHNDNNGVTSDAVMKDDAEFVSALEILENIENREPIKTEDDALMSENSTVHNSNEDISKSTQSSDSMACDALLK
ncbi:hypothetical protein RFI_16268 [Reticulomyxa filosa]|uniref:DNA primase large subunit C-terminal domain-containing protein n=1 Tax=Reticulomyxa filosa TaxID=46433 RepID=X6N4W1_RETFI|nr:hypothetical protein RFI_16268 [Reticulomyxa filosa]|eukprot:ETO20938.1 hypothetical protein RFI_16268 [Reticulomyxa filosa]